MKKLLVKSLLIAGATLVCSADELTWSATPASAVWDNSALNWLNASSESVAWDAVHNATFGESAEKTIVINDTVSATNLTFAADGYTIGGDGTLLLAHPTEDSPEWNFQVDEGVTARIDANVTRQTFEDFVDGILLKKGFGTLHLAGTTTVLRLHSRSGVLDLSGGTLETAKLRASFADNTAVLRLDDTRFKMTGSNSGIFLGESAPFKEATIGAGGLTILSGGAEGEFAQSFATAPGVERDGGIVSESERVLRLSGSASTFNGGVLMKAGQLRITNTGALGSGDVVLRPNSSLYAYSQDVVVTNKIIQAQSTTAGSTGGQNESIIFTSVGVSDDNAKGLFTIGRSNGAYSRAGLSLTGETSEPIGTFALQGDLDFTIDGGVITARADSPSPFFSTMAFSSAHAPTAKIGQGGFTFDSNGATTELGIRLDLSACLVTNIVAAQGFANASFEETVAGKAPQDWTITGGKEAAVNVVNNGSAFTKDDTTCQTPHGNNYLGMRRDSTAATTFEVPENGEWRIFFDMGCRAGNYPTHNITVTVTIDDSYEFVIGPRTARHGFRRFETMFYPLAAGTHTFKITTDTGSGAGYDTILFDMFGAERLHSISAPSVEKRGEGLLGIKQLETDGTINVTAGTLALRKPNVIGATINVSEGAALSLVAGNVGNAAVRVESGGTVSFSDSAVGEDIVKNGSFEVDATSDYKSNGSTWHVTDWLYDWVGENHTSYSGVQRNGGTMSPHGPYTPYGNQTYFLRFDGIMKQTVTVPETGRYKLSFVQAPRIYGNGFKLALSVCVDGSLVITNAPRTANYDFFSSEVEIDLEKGEHELSFAATGSKGSGEMLFLDDVRLEGMFIGTTELPGTVLDLASGATIDVQTSELLLLDEVRVNGHRVRGDAAALRAAGVNVTGIGKVRIGPPQGTLLLVR